MSINNWFSKEINTISGEINYQTFSNVNVVVNELIENKDNICYIFMADLQTNNISILKLNKFYKDPLQVIELSADRIISEVSNKEYFFQFVNNSKDLECYFCWGNGKSLTNFIQISNINNKENQTRHEIKFTDESYDIIKELIFNMAVVRINEYKYKGCTFILTNEVYDSIVVYFGMIFPRNELKNEYLFRVRKNIKKLHALWCRNGRSENVIVGLENTKEFQAELGRLRSSIEYNHVIIDSLTVEGTH